MIKHPLSMASRALGAFDIRDALITIKDGQLTCKMMDIGQVSAAKICMPVTIEDASIAISDIGKFTKLVTKFGDSATIKITDNKLIMTEGGERGWITLGEDDNIDSHSSYMERSKDVDVIQKQEARLDDFIELTLTKQEAMEICSLGKTTEDRFTSFVIEENILRAKSEGEGIGMGVELAKTEGDTTLSAMFGPILTRVLECVTDETVTLYLRTDTPIYIRTNSMSCIIAPIIKNAF